MTRADERLHLLEATQQGVTCLPLRQRLTQYARDGAIVAARIFSWQCDSAQVCNNNGNPLRNVSHRCMREIHVVCVC